jgi:hypothetical protein
MAFGFNDTRSSEKPDGFSLCWKPRIIDEKHYEPHLSEQNNSYKDFQELSERVKRTLGNTGEDVNLPQTPLMPSIKRRKDNQLAMFLEDNTSLNVTKLKQEGISGTKFGEGIESSTGKLKKWAENNKFKD